MSQPSLPFWVMIWECWHRDDALRGGTTIVPPETLEPSHTLSDTTFSLLMLPWLSCIGPSIRFADPLVFGHYPQSMQDLVGNRLPKFTPAQSNLVKGSFDFLGLNYYSSNFAANTTYNVGTNISYSTDNNVLTSNFRNGKPIGEQEGNTTFYVYPKGLQDVLLYTKNRYNNPLVYITENGLVQTGINSVQVGVRDYQRVNFYREHLKYLKKSIELRVNVKGFYPWSFLDTFEWNSGYTYRFGLVYIDYQNGLKRYPKFSALAYKKFLSS